MEHDNDTILENEGMEQGKGRGRVGQAFGASALGRRGLATDT